MSKTVEKVLTEEQNPSIIAGVRCRFFAQYWGVKALYVGGHELQIVGNGGWNLKHPDFFLKLKKLSKITDEEIKEVCKMTHNLSDVSSFDIDRRDDIIHCSYNQSNINAKYHVCLNYKYATINANLHFGKTESEKAGHYKVNIGEIHFSSQRVVGYIQVLDYLRSKGYAIPFMNYSVQNLVDMGWVQF